MGKRNPCPHCNSTARRVECRKCKRDMCADCISTGEVCGLCYDELLKWSRNRKAEQARQARQG